MSIFSYTLDSVDLVDCYGHRIVSPAARVVVNHLMIYNFPTCMLLNDRNIHEVNYREFLEGITTGPTGLRYTLSYAWTVVLRGHRAKLLTELANSYLRTLL